MDELYCKGHSICHLSVLDHLRYSNSESGQLQSIFAVSSQTILFRGNPGPFINPKCIPILIYDLVFIGLYAFSRSYINLFVVAVSGY